MKYGDIVLYKGKHYTVVHIYDDGFVEIGLPEFGDWLSVEIVPVSKLEWIIPKKK